MGLDEPTILVADYSSLEVGILGDLCLRLFGDGQIIGKYDDQERGIDLHVTTAKEVFGKWLRWTVPEFVVVDKKKVECPFAGFRVDQIPNDVFKADPYGGVMRDSIKEVRYGLAYGKEGYGFQTLVGADGQWIGLETANKLVNAILGAEPGQRLWGNWVEKYIKQHGGIYSLGGRWCDLTIELESGDEWQLKRAIRRAKNFGPQATGAEILGDALVRVTNCPEMKKLGFRAFLTVHDEIVMRGPLKNVERAKELLVFHMKAATANGTRLMVKLQVNASHGPNYYEAG